MATKKELEIASLQAQLDAVPKTAPVETPSPVDRRQAYVESHPILGVTRRAIVAEDAAGDGRVGDSGRTEVQT